MTIPDDVTLSSAAGGPFAERHGWKLYRASAFAHALAALQAEVERLAAEKPEAYRAHPKTKLLARVRALIVDEIPRDPNARVYALGNALGRRIAIGGAPSSCNASACSFASTAPAGSSSTPG